jgi:hypothetical protein
VAAATAISSHTERRVILVGRGNKKNSAKKNETKKTGKKGKKK